MSDTVVFDLDGTLVDSVYQHVVAWQKAFHDVGLQASGTAVHGAIGMGGDRLVAHVAGDAAEWAVGDEIRQAHDQHFRALLPTISELDGATELLQTLARTHQVVLASSGGRELTEELLSKVEGAHAIIKTISGSEVENSKPSPDLLLRAAHSVDAEQALVVGDSIWDVLAAEACGFACIGVRSGGNSSERLAGAGAAWVYDGPRDLLTCLATSPLAR